MCNGKHPGSLGELLQLLILQKPHYHHVPFPLQLQQYYELQMPGLPPKERKMSHKLFTTLNKKTNTIKRQYLNINVIKNHIIAYGLLRGRNTINITTCKTALQLRISNSDTTD